MAITVRLPQADDQPLNQPAAKEDSIPDSVVDAIHRMLTDRGEFFDRILNEGIARNAELLDRLAR